MSVRQVLGLLWRLPGGSRGPAILRLLESRTARRRRLEKALRQPAQTVVFVCHGNIMRSAFAAAWTQSHHPGLSRRILSAGTHAILGRRAQQSALAVAEVLKCPLIAHRATPLSAITPSGDTLFICMDKANEANTVARFPRCSERVFLIGDVQELGRQEACGIVAREVRDPYDLGNPVTLDAFQAIVKLLDLWAAAITGRKEWCC